MANWGFSPWQLRLTLLQPLLNTLVEHLDGLVPVAKQPVTPLVSKADTQEAVRGNDQPVQAGSGLKQPGQRGPAGQRWASLAVVGPTWRASCSAQRLATTRQSSRLHLQTQSASLWACQTPSKATSVMLAAMFTGEMVGNNKVWDKTVPIPYLVALSGLLKCRMTLCPVCTSGGRYLRRVGLTCTRSTWREKSYGSIVAQQNPADYSTVHRVTL